MFSMPISRTSLSLSVLGPKVKVTVAILEKHCHHSNALIFDPILIKYTQILGMAIPIKSLRFSVIGSRSKSQ